MNSLKHSEINTFGLRVWNGIVDTSYPPHRHNEIELNAIADGYFTYLHAGQQTTISAGEVGLFWGAIPHQVVAFAMNTHVYWATIPLEYIMRWELPRPFLNALFSGRLFSDPAPLYDLRFFRAWDAELAAGSASVALMEIKALCFRFAHSSETIHSGGVPHRHGRTSDERAQQMAAFISQRFAESITVDDIAAVIGLQPNYAMSIFRQAFGMTLIDYLTQQRIAHAQQLLIMTNINIASVALESGFQTISHFYTTFQRLCGMTPGRYRTSLRR